MVLRIDYHFCCCQVRLDGVDTRELNLRWLRQRIGVVSQEPVLFACSIGQNIAYGRDGVSQAQIMQASHSEPRIINLVKL